MVKWLAVKVANGKKGGGIAGSGKKGGAVKVAMVKMEVVKVSRANKRGVNYRQQDTKITLKKLT